MHIKLNRDATQAHKLIIMPDASWLGNPSSLYRRDSVMSRAKKHISCECLVQPDETAELLIGHFVDLVSGKVKMCFLVCAHNQVLMAFTGICSRQKQSKAGIYPAFQKRFFIESGLKAQKTPSQKSHCISWISCARRGFSGASCQGSHFRLRQVG